MSNPQPILRADDLSKRYEDGVLAVDHLNLNIHPGEAYRLLGANGAGKTTTINLFLNFIPPTTGDFFYFTAGPRALATYALPSPSAILGNQTSR